MKDLFNSPEEALTRSWDLLEKAPHRRKDPFYTPVVGTVNGTEVALRTVVLRRADRQQRSLRFFSDVRSPKIAQIRNSDMVSWLFWNPRKLLQLRIESRAEIHHLDDLALDEWKRVPAVSRKNYCTLPVPGSKLQPNEDLYPPNWKFSEPGMAEMDYGKEHFALVHCRVDRMDILHLHPEGHQRFLLKWNKGKWMGDWLVP